MKPETRGKGIGKAFFAELAKVAQEKVRIHHLHSSYFPLSFIHADPLPPTGLRPHGLVRPQGQPPSS